MKQILNKIFPPPRSRTANNVVTPRLARIAESNFTNTGRVRLGTRQHLIVVSSDNSSRRSKDGFQIVKRFQSSGEKVTAVTNPLGDAAP